MRHGKRAWKQHIRTTAAALAFLLLLGGCGKQFETEKTGERQGAETADRDMIVVGVSQLGSESVWRTAHTTSIEQTFTREKGYLLLLENARQKQENQIKAIRSFISQQVDYIIFSPIEESGWDVVLEEAKEAGIPVIVTDRSLQVEDESLYVTRVGSDFRLQGEKAGLWLEDYLEDQGRSDEEINIVVLKGTEGATSTIGRTEGFEDIASRHSNWNILEQTGADYTTTKAREEMRRIVAQYDDIDVLVSQNDDMTFGALDVFKENGITTGAGGDVAVISFDAVKSALERVQTGEINVDIECNPEQGHALESVIRMLENGATIDRNYYVTEKIFTQENVGRYINDRSY